MRVNSLAILFLATSCAALGTKVRINKSTDVMSIKTIGVITSKSTFPDQSVNDTTDSLFVILLISQLQVATGKEVKYLGETTEFLKQSEKLLSQNNVDAVIQCEIYLTQMATLDKSKRFNSQVRTQMFKTPDKIFLAETNFNTKMGKSYGRNPLLAVAVRDGIVGAVRPLEKVFKTKP